MLTCLSQRPQTQDWIAPFWSDKRLCQRSLRQTEELKNCCNLGWWPGNLEQTHVLTSKPSNKDQAEGWPWENRGDLDTIGWLKKHGMAKTIWGESYEGITSCGAEVNDLSFFLAYPITIYGETEETGLGRGTKRLVRLFGVTRKKMVWGLPVSLV